MNNPPPYIEQIRGYYSIAFLTIISLGFYVPVFYDKFIPKLNTMSRAAFGDNARRVGFATIGWTIGWCIVLSLFVAVVLVNTVFSAAFFNSTVAFPHPIPLPLFVGYIAFWLATVFVMAVYSWRKIYEVKDQIIRLIEHYELHEMSVKYEYNLRNLRFYESKGGMTEKFNFEAARELIEIHNQSRLFGWE